MANTFQCERIHSSEKKYQCFTVCDDDSFMKRVAWLARHFQNLLSLVAFYPVILSDLRFSG